MIYWKNNAILFCNENIHRSKPATSQNRIQPPPTPGKKQQNNNENKMNKNTIKFMISNKELRRATGKMIFF